jgi:FtsH-binding integral membrane protein
MINIKTQISVVMVLAFLSLLAGCFGHLALMYIYNGESDVTQEWRIVQIAAITILFFITSSFFTLNKARKLISR